MCCAVLRVVWEVKYVKDWRKGETERRNKGMNGNEEGRAERSRSHMMIEAQVPYSLIDLFIK